MAEQGRARGRRWIGHLVKVALVVVVTWALYRAIGLNLSELRRLDLASLRPGAAPLAGSAVGLIAVYLLHALLWRRIAGDLVGVRLPIGTAFRVYFLANLGRYLPGRIWQVAGMAVLARRAGIPATGAIAASALAQLSFLCTGALFLTLLMPVLFGIGPAIVAGVAAFGLMGALYWSTGTEGGRRVRARLGERFGPTVAAALDALGRVRPGDAAIWLLGYATSWVLMGGAFALFTIAFVPSAAGEVRHLAATMAAGYLGGYLAIFAPAGVGVREGVLGLLLSEVIPAQAALVVSIASRIWFTVTELMVLLVIPFLGATNDSMQMNITETDARREAL